MSFSTDKIMSLGAGAGGDNVDTSDFDHIGGDDGFEGITGSDIPAQPQTQDDPGKDVGRLGTAVGGFASALSRGFTDEVRSGAIEGTRGAKETIDLANEIDRTGSSDPAKWSEEAQQKYKSIFGDKKMGVGEAVFKNLPGLGMLPNSVKGALYNEVGSIADGWIEAGKGLLDWGATKADGAFDTEIAKTLKDAGITKQSQSMHKSLNEAIVDTIHQKWLDKYAASSPEERAKMKETASGMMPKNENGDIDPRSNPAYGFVDAFDNKVEEALPVNKEYSKEFWAGQLPQGLGSTASFALQGLAARKLSPSSIKGLATWLSTASQGGDSGGVQQFNDAMDHGATMSDAYQAFHLGYGIGTSEAFPIADMFSRLDKRVGGGIWKSIWEMAKQGAEEGIQEVAQKITDNLIASKILKYDPNRDMLEGAGEAGASAFSTGAIMQFVAEMLTGVKHLRSKPSNKKVSDQDPTADGFTRNIETLSASLDDKRASREALAKRLQGAAAKGASTQEINEYESKLAGVDDEINALEMQLDNLRKTSNDVRVNELSEANPDNNIANPPSGPDGPDGPTAGASPGLLQPAQDGAAPVDQIATAQDDHSVNYEKTAPAKVEPQQQYQPDNAVDFSAPSKGDSLTLADKESNVETIPYTPPEGFSTTDKLSAGVMSKLDEEYKNINKMADAAIDARINASLPKGEVERPRRLIRAEYLYGLNKMYDDISGLKKQRLSKGSVDIQADDIATAIRKYGGLNRDDMKAEGYDPASMKGNPMFKAKGGLSLDAMREALAQDGYFEGAGSGSTNELMGMIDRAINGERVMSTGHQPEHSQAYEALKQISDRMGGAEVTPSDVRSVIEITRTGGSLGKRQAKILSAMLDDIGHEIRGRKDPEKLAKVESRLERIKDLISRRADSSTWTLQEMEPMLEYKWDNTGLDPAEALMSELAEEARKQGVATVDEISEYLSSKKPSAARFLGWLQGRGLSLDERNTTEGFSSVERDGHDHGRASEEEIPWDKPGNATGGPDDWYSSTDQEGRHQSGEGFGLALQTEESVRAEELAAEHARQEKKRKEEEEAKKAEADNAAKDFKLTGSSRPADIAMSHGQNDLFHSNDEIKSAPQNIANIRRKITEKIGEMDGIEERIKKVKDDKKRARFETVVRLMKEELAAAHKNGADPDLKKISDGLYELSTQVSKEIFGDGKGLLKTRLTDEDRKALAEKAAEIGKNRKEAEAVVSLPKPEEIDTSFDHVELDKDAGFLAAYNGKSYFVNGLGNVWRYEGKQQVPAPMDVAQAIAKMMDEKFQKTKSGNFSRKEKSKKAATAPEHVHNSGKKLDPDNKFQATATGSSKDVGSIDESIFDGDIVSLEMNPDDFREITDDWAALFEDPEEKVVTAKVAGDFISQEEADKRIAQWKKHVQDQFNNKEIRSRNSDKTILSLFDYTGEWSKPWEEAGYNVIRFDIQNGQDVMDFSVEYFNENWDFGEVYGILAATPCTDFASSGARHFDAKDADGRTEASKELVFKTLETIEYFRPSFWTLENPVGRIERLTGLPKARMTFDPNNFGSPYTKKTVLWGRFEADLPTANVEPTEGSKMHRLYGGKSLATKNARSETPEGFAYAFFMANNYEDLPADKRLGRKYPDASGAITAALKAGVKESDVQEILESTYENGDSEEARNELARAAKKAKTPDEFKDVELPAILPEGAYVSRGLGLAKDKYGVFDHKGHLIGAYESTVDEAIKSAVGRAKRSAEIEEEKNQDKQKISDLRDSLLAGTGREHEAAKYLDLRTPYSGVKYFFPAMAKLFGISSRSVRKHVADLIKITHSDMGAKLEWVKTIDGISAIASNLGAKQAKDEFVPTHSFHDEYDDADIEVALRHPGDEENSRVWVDKHGNDYGDWIEGEDSFKSLFDGVEEKSGTYNAKRIPEAEYRVGKRTLETLNKEERRAFDKFISGRSDGKQILDRLKQNAGTPWAKQAVEGVLIRQAIKEIAEGGKPDFQSFIDHTNASKLRESIRVLGYEGIHSYLESTGYVGSAKKPINNVSSSFINCSPSLNCAKFCYATDGNYRYVNSMIKAEIVSMAVENDPVRAAKRTARQYKATAEFANNKALRLFDKGDGNDAWIPYIRALNKEGIRTHIFSKNPEFLRKVPDMNVRLLSIDSSNLAMADENKDLPVSFVYSGGDTETAFLAKLVERGQIQVVLPVKIGIRVFDREEVKKLQSDVPGVKRYVCPIDGGIKKVGPNDSDGWNCTKCDKNGGVGCYVGSVTKAVLESRDVKSIPSSDLAKRVIELREAINAELGEKGDNGSEGSVAGNGSEHKGRIQNLLLDADRLMGELLSRYEPDAETRNAFEGSGGAAVQDRLVQGARGKAEEIIPARQVEEDGGEYSAEEQPDLFGGGVSNPTKAQFESNKERVKAVKIDHSKQIDAFGGPSKEEVQAAKGRELLKSFQKDPDKMWHSRHTAQDALEQMGLEDTHSLVRDKRLRKFKIVPKMRYNRDYMGSFTYVRGTDRKAGISVYGISLHNNTAFKHYFSYSMDKSRLKQDWGGRSTKKKVLENGEYNNFIQFNNEDDVRRFVQFGTKYSQPWHEKYGDDYTRFLEDKNSVAQDPGMYEQADLFAADTKEKSASKMVGYAKIKTKLVSIGRVAVGLSKVESFDDAAHVFAAIRKSPQEKLMILGMDKDNNLLEVHMHGKGTNDSASIKPGEVIGSLLQSKATTFYIAHNHPSGNTEPSVADRRINERFAQLAKMAGLDFKGHLVIGQDSSDRPCYTVITKDGDVTDTATPIKPKARLQSTNLVERRFISNQGSSAEELTSPTAARRFCNKNLDGPGILLMDNKHRPISFIPMDMDKIDSIKSGNEAATTILREAADTNAAAMIVNTGSDRISPAISRSLNGLVDMASLADIRVLDAFAKEGSTAAEMGVLEAPAKYEGKKYRRGGSGVGITKDQAQAVIDKFLKTYKGAASLKFNMRETPADLYSEAAMRAHGLTDNVAKGAYEKGRVDVFWGNHATVEDFENTLRHEVWVHHGLNTLKPADKARLLRELEAARMATPEIRDIYKAVIQSGYSGDVVPEEVMARIAEMYGDTIHGKAVAQAEQGKLVRAIRRIFEALRNALRNIGVIRDEDPVDRVIEVITGRAEALARNESGEESGGSKMKSEKPGMFYSALSRAAEGLKQDKGTPEQMLAILSKTPGVKPAEIEATGLKEFMQLQGKSVTKQQIVDFLKNNGVQVHETMLGGVDVDMEGALDYPFAVIDDDGHIVEAFETEEEANDYAGENGGEVEPTSRAMQRATNDSTKYSSYVLHGGKNYRELLLTLPQTNFMKEYEDYKSSLNKKYGSALDAASEQTDEENAKLKELAEKGRSAAIGKTEKFKSSHYDQPNILAHVRFNERTDADGKRVLFLEELQSDWAQKGRKEGFAGGKTLEDAKKFFGISDDSWSKMSANDKQAYLDEMNSGASHVKGAVPSAPFVTSTDAWVGLALKRMITYAAQNGFDRVAWTTGEQQADRYDLSKQVDSVEAFKNEDGTFDVEAWKGGKMIEEQRRVPESKLESLFGKDLAKKIINEEGEYHPLNGYRSYTGDDLKVGGEGMKSFYDKIVPKVASNIIKKMGGSLRGFNTGEAGAKRTGDFLDSVGYDWRKDQDKGPKGVGSGNLSFDITPQLREFVLNNGLPLFSKRPGFTFDAKSSPLYKTRTASSVGLKSKAEINAALEKDATSRKIMAKGNTLHDGDLVGVRLNINVLKNQGVAVNSIHAGKGTGYQNNAGLFKGQVLMYQAATTLRDAYFNVGQLAREKIATGVINKEPMASVDGNYVDAAPNFDGVEFRFNPHKDHLFIDAYGRALRRADEVTVHANSVYARGQIEYFDETEVPERRGDAPSRARILDPKEDLTGKTPMFSRGEALTFDGRRRGFDADGKPFLKNPQVAEHDEQFLMDDADADHYVRNLLELNQHADTRRTKISHEKDMAAIVKDIAPAFSVSDMEVDTDHNTMPDGTKFDKAWAISVPTHDNKQVNAMVMQDSINKTVWLNVSDLDSGAGGGFMMYAIMADYAHNNGLVFIGDPMGLSDIAAVRRTENMLNAAIRWGGDTSFIRPHPKQLGDENLYHADATKYLHIKKWIPGDNQNNLRELAKSSYYNMAVHVPEIQQINWDNDLQDFVTEGVPVTNELWGYLHDKYVTGLAKSDFSYGPPKLSNPARISSPGFAATLRRGIIGQPVFTSTGGQVRQRVNIRNADGGGILAKSLVNISYSRGGEAKPITLLETGHPGSGIRSKQLQSALGSTIKKAKDRGLQVVIHQRFSDLPEDMKRNPGASVILLGKEIHLIASNLDRPSAARRAIDRQIKRASGAITGNERSFVESLNSTIRKAAEPVKFEMDRVLEGLKNPKLSVLTRRHLADVGRRYLPQIKSYVDLAQRMDADRNDLLANSAELADNWRKWAQKNPEQADALAGLMHDSTVAGVDPSRPYSEIITEDAATEQIKTLREQIRGRSGDENQKLFAKIDEVKASLAFERNRQKAYPELRDAWNKMTPEAQDIYRAARDEYKLRTRQTMEALVDRIQQSIADEKKKKALIDMVRYKFESNKVNDPYFPLQRFGPYWVATKDAEGNTTDFAMFETEREWAEYRDMLNQAGEKIVSGKKVYTALKSESVSPNFITDIDSILSEIGGPQIENLRDQVYQLYLQTLPDMSSRKHFIHRKKTAGYSTDAIRAYSHNMFHGGYQLARLRWSHKLEKVIDEIGDTLAIAGSEDAIADLRKKVEQGEGSHNQLRYAMAARSNLPMASDLLGELKLRHEWAMSPKGGWLANRISSIGFAWYLGASVSSAIVNTTQVPLVAFPVLGSKFGFDKAAAEITRAYKDYLAGGVGRGTGFFSIGKTLKGDELSAYQQFIRDGVIDKTLAHDLAGLAQEGSDYNAKNHQIMKAISMAFHKAEVLNREVTAIAAYRLARKNGMSHELAMYTAEEMVWESQYDYSTGNKARIMQSDAAKVVLMFRQYALNTSYLLLRNIWQSLPARDVHPAIAREARRKIGAILGMHFLAAGFLGILPEPIYPIIKALIESLVGSDDDPYDLDTEIRIWAAQAFGKQLGQAMTTGLANAYLGVDLHNRISLSQLWLRDDQKDVDGKRQYEAIMDQLMGPFFGGIASAFTGASLIAHGYTLRGLEKMSPKAVKDILKTVRYAVEGVKTMRGDILADNLTPLETAYQIFGFAPSRISDRNQENAAIQNAQHRIENRRKTLIDRYNQAVKSKDADNRAAAKADIDAFNKANPTFEITPGTLARSAANQARYQAQSQDGIVIDRRFRDDAKRIDFAQ